MKNNNSAARDILILSVGELVAAALTVAGFAIAQAYVDVDFLGVTLGALIGAAVTVANFVFLTLSVNRAIDSYMEIRGSKEMSDEEAEKFTAEHSMQIQNAVKTSFIIRTVSMLALLVLAFLTGWVNPLATVIPLLAYRPILAISESIRRRRDPAPNPDAFIHYEDDESDAKESDD